MTIKIKKMPVKMSIVITAFLFACNSGNRQTEQMSSVTTSDTVSNKGGAIANETTDMDTKKVSESRMAIDNETAEADSTAVYINGIKVEWMPYPLVDVQPLFDGKDWSEELHKHFDENQKLKKIAEEAGIKEEWSVGYLFFIDRDGSVVDISIFFNDKIVSVLEENMEEPSYQQLLAAEMLRLLNSTQGKWTPAKHQGKLIKVRIGGSP